MVRKGNALVIDSPLFEDDFASIPQGVQLRVSISRPKDPALQRYLWALCAVVANNCDDYVDREQAFDDLLMKVGHYEELVHPRTGVVTRRRLSTKGLDHEAMKRLVERVKCIVVRDILPGIETDALAEEIERMLVGRERK